MVSALIDAGADADADADAAAAADDDDDDDDGGGEIFVSDIKKHLSRKDSKGNKSKFRLNEN